MCACLSSFKQYAHAINTFTAIQEQNCRHGVMERGRQETGKLELGEHATNRHTLSTFKRHLVHVPLLFCTEQGTRIRQHPSFGPWGAFENGRKILCILQAIKRVCVSEECATR